MQGSADVRSFFDRCAAAYSEQHGNATHLLARRLDLIRKHARLRRQDVVLDIGCGPGVHLTALAPEIARGMGVDLSPAMVAVARRRCSLSPFADGLSFEVDDAETLLGIPSGSVDLLLCIGVLEHVIDKQAALRSAHRVLRPGGRFFFLGPAGDYIWYTACAPLLGFATKHLSTDVFLTRSRLTALLADARFEDIQMGSWQFIPKGDMPALMASALAGLDALGRLTRWSRLRGGLWACAWKS